MDANLLNGLDPDLVDGIDKLIEDRDEAPAGRMSRNDALNVIVRDWLMAQGYIELPSDPNEAG
jgi:hypothetical protein